MSTSAVLARRNQLEDGRADLTWESGPTLIAFPTFASLAETASALTFAFALGLAFTRSTFTATLAQRLP